MLSHMYGTYLYKSSPFGNYYKKLKKVFVMQVALDTLLTFYIISSANLTLTKSYILICFNLKKNVILI